MMQKLEGFLKIQYAEAGISDRNFIANNLAYKNCWGIDVRSLSSYASGW